MQNAAITGQWLSPAKLTLHLLYVTTHSENNKVTDVVKPIGRKQMVHKRLEIFLSKKMIDQVATPTGILLIVSVTPLSNAACHKQAAKDLEYYKRRLLFSQADTPGS